MDDPLAVRVLEPGARLDADLDRRLGAEPPLGLEELRDRFALDVLHHDVVAELVDAGVVDLDDVGMDQLRDRERLAAEAGDELFVVGEVFGEDLDRDGPLENAVGRPVDGRHPAGAEPVAELVAIRDQGVHRCCLSPIPPVGPTPPPGFGLPLPLLPLGGPVGGLSSGSFCGVVCGAGCCSASGVVVGSVGRLLDRRRDLLGGRLDRGRAVLDRAARTGRAGVVALRGIRGQLEQLDRRFLEPLADLAVDLRGQVLDALGEVLGLLHRQRALVVGDVLVDRLHIGEQRVGVRLRDRALLTGAAAGDHHRGRDRERGDAQGFCRHRGDTRDPPRWSSQVPHRHCPTNRRRARCSGRSVAMIASAARSMS